MYAPTTPIVFDSIGYCHDYLKNDVFIESPSPVFASEYLCEEKLLFGMKNMTHPFFLYDLTDYLSPIYGRIIDRPILQRISKNQVKIACSSITKAKLDLSLVSIFTAQIDFCFNNDFKANSTIINAN